MHISYRPPKTALWHLERESPQIGCKRYSSDHPLDFTKRNINQVYSDENDLATTGIATIVLGKANTSTLTTVANDNSSNQV